MNGQDTVRELWAVNVESGETRQLSLDAKGRPGNFSLHPDGKHVAIAVNASRKEVWKLENFLP